MQREWPAEKRASGRMLNRARERAQRAGDVVAAVSAEIRSSADGDTRPYTFIWRRYSLSQAAGMLSRELYGPGSYARDAIPCWLSSHTCQSCLFVTSQNSIASSGLKSSRSAASG